MFTNILHLAFVTSWINQYSKGYRQCFSPTVIGRTFHIHHHSRSYSLHRSRGIFCTSFLDQKVLLLIELLFIDFRHGRHDIFALISDVWIDCYSINLRILHCWGISHHWSKYNSCFLLHNSDSILTKNEKWKMINNHCNNSQLTMCRVPTFTRHFISANGIICQTHSKSNL